MDKRAPIANLDQVLKLDKRVHEPARLVVLAILSTVDSADFAYLMQQTGLTQGNLSAHLSKLEAAELISVEKGFAGKRPRTTLSLTQAGRDALIQHGRTLTRFLKLTGLSRL